MLAVVSDFVRVATVESEPEALLARFEDYEAPKVVKWLNVGTI